MKKTMLWTALATLISTQVIAETTPAPAQAPAKPQTTAAAPTTQPAPAAKAQPNMLVINCEYRIPTSNKKVDPGTVTSWTEKAVVQAFDMDHTTLDKQMQQLQKCFTEQGWQGFNTALQKSGNLDAIKTQKLNVSSQIDGKVELVEAKDSQWKIALPLQVVYQNDKEKVTQLLQVNLSIGRKKSGDLGIIQIVATPRSDVAQNQNAKTAANTVTPPVNAVNPATPAQPATN